MNSALLEKQEWVKQYLQENPGQLSGFSFVNIFAWADFFQFDFKVIDENLCIFASYNAGTFLYLPPLGKNISSNAIQSCFARMEKENCYPRISRVENVAAHQLSFFPAEEFSYYNKGYEYCYYRKNLINLTGNLYKSKRSSYNQFIKNHTFKYLFYADVMLPECEALYSNWAKNRRASHKDNDISLAMLEENATVHKTVLQNWRDLGLIGRVVVIDGEVKAYTFGYHLNDEMFCVLFEIADLSVKGLSAFIFREFCRDPQVAPYKFINAMDDFELNNIQNVKMSFKPAALLPSYTITKKSQKTHACSC